MPRYLPNGCAAVPVHALDNAMNRLGMIIAACSSELPADGDQFQRAVLDRARAGVWAESALHELKLHRIAAGIDPYEEPATAARINA
jgi:hypothetical protein